MRRASVLRHRDFRLLFIGQSISQVGSQAVFVAMALYITRRTGSASDLSVILAAESLPLVVLIVFGGVWADRLRRDRILIGSDTVRLFLHLLLGTLIITGSPAIWLIAVIEAMFGAASALFYPAYTGLIPQTVPEDEIQAAQALRTSTENLAMVLGPVCATALVLTLGAGIMFLFDAFSFLVGAVLLLPVRPRERLVGQAASAVAGAKSDFLHELRVGFREVRSRGWVWATIVAYSGVLVVSVVPLLAVSPTVIRHLYGNVGLYGVLITIFGCGAVVASGLATRWHPRHPLRLALMFGIPWSLLGLVIALGAPEWVLYISALVSGGSGALTGVWWETTLARHIPPQSLSRVSAWDWMGSMALMPIGYAVAGPLAAALGGRCVLGVGSVLGAVLAAAALLAPDAMTLPAAPASGEASAEQL